MKTSTGTILAACATICSLAASSQAQQPGSTVLCWMNHVTNPNADTFGKFSVFDQYYNVYMVSQVVQSGKPDLIKIQKFGEYGNLEKTITVTTLSKGTPRGFALDGLGDMFLLYNQLDQYYGASEIFAGWNSGYTQLFSKNLDDQTNTFSGMGLATDGQNNVYLALNGQSISSGTQYMKFSRTGVQTYSNNVNFYGNYAQFDSAGRCCVIGNTYDSMAHVVAADAAVFNPADGSVPFRKHVLNGSGKNYYFGGATFDSAGDLYLNTITSTGPNTATSVADAYGKTYTKLWEATGLSGFAWYAGAKNPTYAFVWGSSDIYNSTGQFMANVSGGKLAWQQSTYGEPIGWVGVDDVFAQYTAPDGTVHNLTIDPKTGKTADIIDISAPVGQQSHTSFGLGQINTLWNSQTVTVNITHQVPPSNDTPTAKATGFGCYLLMVRSASPLLSTLTAPPSVKSGASYSVTVGTNANVAAGSVTVALSVANGAFSNGLTTENVTISAPNQTVATTVKTAPTSAAKYVTVTAKEAGSLRTASTTEYPPGIAGIVVATSVTAHINTTEPYKVTMNGIAATGGVGITITSSNPSVILNGTATVPAGGTTVSGNLTVLKVTSQQTVKVTFKTSTGSMVTESIVVSP